MKEMIGKVRGMYYKLLFFLYPGGSFLDVLIWNRRKIFINESVLRRKKVSGKAIHSMLRRHPGKPSQMQKVHGDSSRRYHPLETKNWIHQASPIKQWSSNEKDHATPAQKAWAGSLDQKSLRTVDGAGADEEDHWKESSVCYPRVLAS